MNVNKQSVLYRECDGISLDCMMFCNTKCQESLGWIYRYSVLSQCTVTGPIWSLKIADQYYMPMFTVLSVERLHYPRRRVVVCGDSLGSVDIRSAVATVVTHWRAGGCKQYTGEANQSQRTTRSTTHLSIRDVWPSRRVLEFRRPEATDFPRDRYVSAPQEHGIRRQRAKGPQVVNHARLRWLDCKLPLIFGLSSREITER